MIDDDKDSDDLEDDREFLRISIVMMPASLCIDVFLHLMVGYIAVTVNHAGAGSLIPIDSDDPVLGSAGASQPDLWFGVVQEAQSNWGFDMFRLDAATDGHCLSCLCFWLLMVMPEFDLSCSCYSCMIVCLVASVLSTGWMHISHMCLI